MAYVVVSSSIYKGAISGLWMTAKPRLQKTSISSTWKCEDTLTSDISDILRFNNIFRQSKYTRVAFLEHIWLWLQNVLLPYIRFRLQKHSFLSPILSVNHFSHFTSRFPCSDFILSTSITTFPYRCWMPAFSHSPFPNQTERLATGWQKVYGRVLNGNSLAGARQNKHIIHNG